MYNDGKSLKPILKESYGGKMKKKCKGKPFSKLVKKYTKKGKDYKDGGSFWDKAGDMFSGEGAKKSIRTATGQKDTFRRPSEEKTEQQKILEAAQKKKDDWTYKYKKKKK